MNVRPVPGPWRHGREGSINHRQKYIPDGKQPANKLDRPRPFRIDVAYNVFFAAARRRAAAFAAPSVKYRQFGLMPGDYKTKTVALKVKDAHPYDVYGAY